MYAENATQYTVVVRLDVCHDDLSETGVVAKVNSATLADTVDRHKIHAPRTNVNRLYGNLLECPTKGSATVDTCIRRDAGMREYSETH